MIADDIRLSRLMYDLVDQDPQLEAVTQGLSITTFRFVPTELHGRTEEADVAKYLNDLNSALVSNLQSSAELFVSNAVVNGKYVLRACITNWRTEEENVRAVPQIAARVGAQLHNHMRKQVLVNG
jgi:glutamate/tyrosine decarboxylase-like PLP-dependent enzyme